MFLVSKLFIVLQDGFGNRLNTIFNFLPQIDDITFIWYKKAGYCPFDCIWEDLFSYPKLNIIYSEKIPEGVKKDSLIKFDWVDPLHNKYPYYQYSTSDFHTNLVKTFIDSLVPSMEVKQWLFEIPSLTNGHAVRTSHPNSKIGRTPPIKVPVFDFLTTDNQWVKEINPNCLQTKSTGGPYSPEHNYKCSSDKHSSLRNKQGCIWAVADWLMLFKCNIIYEYGTYFNGFNCHKHTSFLDAHRIYGKSVINRTANYDVGSEPWKSHTKEELNVLKEQLKYM